MNMLKYANALIAQSVEHAAVNRSVIGSSPIEGAKKDKSNLDLSFLLLTSSLFTITFYFFKFATYRLLRSRSQ